MCTIVFRFEPTTAVPVMVGMNRDERYDRPAKSPQLIDTNPDILAPVDAVAGGTWIGTNCAGIVIAIANKSAPASGNRSRGLLVREALAYLSHRRAVAKIRTALRTDAYAGCAILVASPEQATLVEWTGKLNISAFAPGIHVIRNAGHDELTADTAVVRSRLMATESCQHRLGTVLADHGVPTCIHADTVGTRSSTIIQWTAIGAPTVLHRQGPPCRGEYKSYHELLIDGRTPQ